MSGEGARVCTARAQRHGAPPRDDACARDTCRPSRARRSLYAWRCRGVISTVVGCRRCAPRLVRRERGTLAGEFGPLVANSLRVYSRVYEVSGYVPAVVGVQDGAIDIPFAVQRDSDATVLPVVALGAWRFRGDVRDVVVIDRDPPQQHCPRRGWTDVPRGDEVYSATVKAIRTTDGVVGNGDAEAQQWRR